MSLALFLARRFYKGSGERGQKMASSPAIRVATLGIALGLAVMIVTQAVVSGFQQEVMRKVNGFASHIEVINPQSFGTPETHAIDALPAFMQGLTKDPNVAAAHPVAYKMGIIKTDTDFMSIQLKGVGADYDTTFIRSCLVEGRLPRFGVSAEVGDDGLPQPGVNDILISRRQADAMQLKVGDRVFAYFFEDDIRQRRFTIVGIYETHMSLFDKTFVMAPFATIVSLNNWDESPLRQPCTSVEVTLRDFSQLQPTAYRLADLIKTTAKRPDGEGLSEATPLTVREHYPQVFSWLDLLDFNMVVILILMVCVAGFTMVSGLFILILERTQTIGVLKALGATNAKIRHTFLWFAAMIIVRGMLIGDVLALGLMAAQQHWGFAKLDPQTYYVDTVPVLIEWLPMLLINLGTLVITTLALVGPSYMVSRIQPAKAIRFE